MKGGGFVKKIFIFLTLLILSVTMVACQDNDVIYDEEPDLVLDAARFTELENTLDAEIPYFFNQNILLPSVSDFTLEWTFNDEAITNILIYEPPMIDTEVTLSVVAHFGETTETYTFEMLQLAPDSAANANVMHIQVDIPIEDVTKTTYRNASVRVFGRNNSQYRVVFENNMVEIRGRGNSTWAMPKRPYRLKFSEDVSILGMPAARNYVLLNEYADKSLLRNTIAYKFSGMLTHIEHAASTRVVEVYFNGRYNGVYTLTEHMEIHENKLFVPTDPNSLDAGYFFELDQRFYEHGYIEGYDGFNVSNNPYTVKFPSDDILTPSHIEYIRNYVVDMESALRNQSGYENYLDVDNFIDYFIVQELFKNVDVGWGSVFIYKRPNEVLKLGPIWDFDLAIGNADYIDYGFQNWYGMRDHKNIWFQLMMAIPEVRTRFRDRYIEIYDTIIPDILRVVESFGEAMQPVANRNFNRWDILNHYVWPNPNEVVSQTTYQGQVDYIYNYIDQRATWMYYAVQSPNFQNGIFD